MQSVVSRLPGRKGQHGGTSGPTMTGPAGRGSAGHRGRKLAGGQRPADDHPDESCGWSSGAAPGGSFERGFVSVLSPSPYRYRIRVRNSSPAGRHIRHRRGGLWPCTAWTRRRPGAGRTWREKRHRIGPRHPDTSSGGIIHTARSARGGAAPGHGRHTGRQSSPVIC